MKVTIEELEAYLLDHYSNGGIDQSLFMKLVEEIGEVAEVLNKKAGRKNLVVRICMQSSRIAYCRRQDRRRGRDARSWRR